MNGNYKFRINIFLIKHKTSYNIDIDLIKLMGIRVYVLLIILCLSYQQIHYGRFLIGKVADNGGHSTSSPNFSQDSLAKDGHFSKIPHPAAPAAPDAGLKYKHVMWILFGVSVFLIVLSWVVVHLKDTIKEMILSMSKTTGTAEP